MLLSDPLKRLDRAFREVLHVALKLQDHKWYTRLTADDDILREIDQCNQDLNDCTFTYSLSVQHRILNSFKQLQTPRIHIPDLPSGDLDETRSTSSLGSFSGITNFGSSISLDESDHSNLSAEQLKSTILRLQAEQKRRDRERDLEDLKHRAKKAVRSRTWPSAQSDLVIPRSTRGEQAVKRVSDEVPLSDILLMHTVGQGPLSRVYKAIWNEKVVAVKIYANNLSVMTGNSSTIQDIVQNEFRIWKKLDHPNILPFHYRGSSSDSPVDKPVYFAMSPFMSHGNVSAYLSQMKWNYNRIPGRPKGLDERRMFLDTAKGMKYLHDHMILHGNLKGANVLVDDNWRCLVSDFKYSKDLKDTDDTGGDIHYDIRWQAPEVLRTKSDLRESVDIYAYAVFCTEVLNSGEIPWPNWSDEDIKNCVLQNGRPGFPPDFADELGVRNIIEKSWAKYPDMRPRFKDIIRDLEDVGRTRLPLSSLGIYGIDAVGFNSTFS
ncbi:hypothetical protein NP233_g5123 [Leucocoprinus birnbaumii]|uniref:Protein kinase domain-containing protein n=1 Tax=Leucocoprinus birnbaumii TaxID=56174 RepID=A0AAD5VUV2_9AGAR|nr:hypothetical protein NP233_g5123 [Leucocoprinus birnbaumii]